jgi:hypothetical protein
LGDQQWLRVAEMFVVLKIPETTKLRRREGTLQIQKLTQKKRKQMTPEERVRLLQLKLYQKAKQVITVKVRGNLTCMVCKLMSYSLLFMD